MYAIHKNVYQHSEHELVCTDIKYGPKYIVELGDIMFINDDYLVLKNDCCLFVFGKNELVITTMHTVNVWIVNDKMIIHFWGPDLFWLQRTYEYTRVYDLADGTNIKYRFNVLSFEILEISNGNVLVHVPKYTSLYQRMAGEYRFREYKFRCFDDFLDYAMGNDGLRIPVAIRYPYYFGECGIVNVVVRSWFVVQLVIYDLECCDGRPFDVAKYGIRYDKNKVAIRNVIYVWDDDAVLIFDNGHVIIIKNRFYVQTYSRYYDVFIGRRLRMYKIRGEKLVRYRLEYDYWHDIDKPVDIQLIMDALMDLDLFPPEVYNALYHILIIQHKYRLHPQQTKQ